MSLERNPNGPFPGDSAFRRDSLKGTQWEPTYAGALSFMRRKYSRDLKGVDIAVTGIPFDQGRYLSNYPTFAEMCADSLKSMGADPAKVKPAPALKVNLERTRAMATGLKQTLDTMVIPPDERKLNLFTNGTHAFRSRMLFQRVLGPSWKVGVVSVTPAGYMPGAWWHYSEGIKSVIEELIAIVGQSMSP